MSDKLYDILNIVQRWLVALGVAYLGIASIWGLPWGDEINQSVVVISTLLATIIEISKAQWRKDHAIEIKDFTEEK